MTSTIGTMHRYSVFVMAIACSAVLVESTRHKELNAFYKLFKSTFNSGGKLCQFFHEDINYVCSHPQTGEKESWTGRDETCDGWDGYRETFKITDITKLSYKHMANGHVHVSGTIHAAEGDKVAKVHFQQHLHPAEDEDGFVIKMHRGIFYES